MAADIVLRVVQASDEFGGGCKPLDDITPVVIKVEDGCQGRWQLRHSEPYGNSVFSHPVMEGRSGNSHSESAVTQSYPLRP